KIEISCNDHYFIKIHTCKSWQNKEIQEREFGSWNLDKDNNNLNLNLYKVYCKEFEMFAALHTYKVLFFDYISYVVFEDNDDSLEEYNSASSHVKVQVG